MNLKEKLNQDFIVARKAKNKKESDVLTMVRTAIRYKELEKKQELSDSDLVAVIAHEIKQRKDSVEQFLSGQRQDLANKEIKEIEILMRYLPAQLSEKEVSSVIAKAIGKIGASGPQDMGKVMGLAMKELKGKADGKMVQKLVCQQLSKV